ncbi:MAG TPA: pyridoxamine 5'-phosphate oxidase family protein [Candidatus Dormibacteraeota bacterium]|nr:pyridoxamine 5'-phosphate oxidase family protein [Candidatus Dormibacteraeota bacterium]
MASVLQVQAMPAPVVELLNKALVAELTVIDAQGGFCSDPLIPLWDGRHILMTSSMLFSRKLQDIKRNPKVSVSLSDPVGVPAQPFSRATIQGDARVIDNDLHQGWYQVLPLWEAKEPIIKTFLKPMQKLGLPLFWERAVIEITPRRVFWWPEGDTTREPQVTDLSEGRR